MSGSPFSVLYVDDEPDHLDLARRFLEKTGEFTVTTQASAAEALSLLAAGSFDAIIADYQMPGMDGIEFLKKVRQLFCRIPFILFTGKGREEVAIGALNNGADYYLQKGSGPLQFTELARTVRQVIRAGRAELPLVESMTHAVLVVGRDNNPLFGNRALALLFGFGSFDEFAGTETFRRLAGGSSDQGFRKPAETGAGAPAVRDTRRFTARDGTERWIEAAQVPVRFCGQDAALICPRDATEEHALGHRLSEMHRKLAILSTDTRHDVLNKLTVLFGHLTILKERVTDPAVRQSIDKAGAAADAIRKQVEFTRQYERIGREPPCWQDVADLVKKTAPPVALSVNVDRLEIHADPMLLEVLSTLVTNSLRHGMGVTEISVTCSRVGTACSIIVADNGQGILPEEKDEVFRKGYGRNSGMGLFLAREILAVTGISIRETGEYGRGARFVITVPEGCFRCREPPA